MAFEVTLEHQFSGPMDLLLSLIEKEELPIVDISLAAVASAYLTYLDTHTVPALERADFLVVASRLLYIKSKAVLPAVPQEEESVSDLSKQLQAYQICRDMVMALEPCWESHHQLMERPRASFQKRPSTKDLTLEPLLLEERMNHVLRRLRPFFRLGQKAMERVATLEERLTQLKEKITTEKVFPFSSLFNEKTKKIDVVLHFLALLELYKERAVEVDQSSHFADISIRQPAS